MYDGIGNAIDIIGSNCTLKNCNIYCFKASSDINIKGNNTYLILNNFKNENGIYAFYINSNNNTLQKNTFSSINGSIIYNSNNNYLFNNTFIFRNYSSKLKIINSFNNDIYANNLSVGIDLLNSGNNIFHSNWIYNKQTSLDNLNDYYMINLSKNFYSNHI